MATQSTSVVTGEADPLLYTPELYANYAQEVDFVQASIPASDGSPPGSGRRYTMQAIRNGDAVNLVYWDNPLVPDFAGEGVNAPDGVLTSIKWVHKQ